MLSREIGLFLVDGDFPISRVSGSPIGCDVCWRMLPSIVFLVEFKPLSTTHSGFATTTRGNDELKMRIAIHDTRNEPRRCGVLCHELAHILLGHLGTDADHWQPLSYRPDYVCLFGIEVISGAGG